MCVLCGEMIMNVHWTDRPLHDTEYRVKRRIVAGEGQRDRRRMRIRRVAVANKILDFYGLTLKDWQGSKYVLSDKKGSTKVVNDLGDMWRTAEAMSHKRLDPLDPKFLASLEREVDHG